MQNNTIDYNDNTYLVISSTRYLNIEYLFVINIQDKNDIKFLMYLDRLEEVDDIALIKKVSLLMNI